MANNLHISYDLYQPGQNYDGVIAKIVDCHRELTRDFHREVTRLMVMFRMSYVGQDAGFSFLGLACWAELFLNRKLSLPVSRMWQ